MMRYGIPAYRLPRDVLDAEIDRIRALGVRFEQGHRVEDLDAERRAGGFDAVFVAVGAHLSTRVDIPNQDARRVLDAVGFLRGVASGEQGALTGRVAVYGGGNTAIDAARVARRLGADDTVIVYRRTREQMPAHLEEAADAEEEGIRINWLRTIASMGADDLTVEVQELDDQGRPHGTGRFETLAADTVILALGQESDTGFLHTVPGVEFDGDVVVVSTDDPDDRRSRCLRRRRRRAQRAHRHRRGRPREAGGPQHRRVAAGGCPTPPAPSTSGPTSTRSTSGTSGCTSAGSSPSSIPRPGSATSRRSSRASPPRRPASRPGGACPAATASSATAAWVPARRMRSSSSGPGLRYEFDYESCTGCGTCYRQCPVHAIEMVPEA